MTDVLITAAELTELLESGTPVHLLDVRWQLGGPPGHVSYLTGHLPGAVYVDLETELAAPASAADGRHPLPDLDELQYAARRWGLRTGDTVVVYDDTGGLAAARAWWLLRWGSVARVFLLDGGLRAWTANGGALETDDAHPAAGDIDLEAGGLPVLTNDAVAALATGGTLLDARAGERYRGEVEPVDRVAGHIPGAISAPTSENLAPAGTFRSAAELAERFAALGIERDAQVGVYCGSGVTAAHEIVALAVAGYRASLYPGSWSQWINLPGRPIETGDRP
jgi:thiosulfate/3-mercaptopyruvate sulfurtransferase